MSDPFYNLIWHIGNPIFWLSASPRVLNAEVTRRPGAYILAANHQTPYDVPLLMRHTARNVDFVSIVEVFKQPLVGWFYGSMNAFPLDRSKPDAPTIRIILDRLSRGRVVGMFPEGRLRKLEDSVLTGAPIRKGIGRIARIASVPIIPCVVLDSAAYSNPASWLPLKRIKYRMAYGNPLERDATLSDEDSDNELEQRTCAELRALYEKICAAS